MYIIQSFQESSSPLPKEINIPCSLMKGDRSLLLWCTITDWLRIGDVCIIVMTRTLIWKSIISPKCTIWDVPVCRSVCLSSGLDFLIKNQQSVYLYKCLQHTWPLSSLNFKRWICRRPSVTSHWHQHWMFIIVYTSGFILPVALNCYSLSQNLRVCSLMERHSSTACWCL